jgi:hypothetical protein
MLRLIYLLMSALGVPSPPPPPQPDQGSGWDPSG